MNLHSAIYQGHVRHRRRTPPRSFIFPLFMVYLDLSELEEVLSMTRFWGCSWLCPARFRREDFIGPHNVSLDEAVRARVEASLGRRPLGPVRVLTHLRYFGYIFNPVTFYYCFDTSEQITAIVSEITNTPWGERHAYVLDANQLSTTPPHRSMRWRFGKEFHVSPFLPLDLEYDWSFTAPAQSLLVHMNVRDRRPGAHRVFDATLRLDRQEITPARLRGLLVRYPLLTVQVIAKIHYEALKLWLARAPVYPHPAPARPPTNISTHAGNQV